MPQLVRDPVIRWCPPIARHPQKHGVPMMRGRSNSVAHEGALIHVGKPGRAVGEVEDGQNPKSNVSLLIGCSLPQKWLQSLLRPFFLQTLYLNQEPKAGLRNVNIDSPRAYISLFGLWMCFGEGAIGDRQGGPIIAAK